MAEASAGAEERVAPRPVVAHVNYLHFHSTQSFIFFTLAHQRRYRPICLTRAPANDRDRDAVPADWRGRFHYFGDDARAQRLWRAGNAVRRVLTRMPPPIALPALSALHRRIVPLVRHDADPRRFVDWTTSLLRAHRAALLHAWFGPVGWRMLEIRRRLRIPLVVTFLGDDLAPALDPWWHGWIREPGDAASWPERRAELFAEADLVLAEGPFLARRLVELGCPEAKVEVQRIGISLGSLRSRRASARRARLLFAGRFCEQKGLLDLLEAVRLLRTERDDFELRLIGDETLTDGGYAARVNTFLRRHALADTVRRLGFLSHAEYLDELERADLFVHPSVVAEDGRAEGGAPTTILEAQAAGLPVVSTLHCDIPHVTVPGESAWLVPERDPAALAAAIRTLLDDPGRRTRMGVAGRRHVERFHDAARETGTLEERYARLLRRESR